MASPPQECANSPKQLLNAIAQELPKKSPRNYQRTCQRNRSIMLEEPYEITPFTPKRHRPRMPPKIWPGSPRGRCKTSTRDSPKAVAQETPKSWPGPHKDFVSRRKAFCRTLPRLPTRSARLPQRLRKAVARVCPQDVVKTPPAPCRTSTITPRGSRPRMPHEFQKKMS